MERMLADYVHCISITRTYFKYVEEIIIVYFENHTKRTNTLCGQNAEFFFDVKADDASNIHLDFKM
jgi:hypothetical protein